jgi:hypothetical protein
LGEPTFLAYSAYFNKWALILSMVYRSQ